MICEERPASNDPSGREEVSLACRIVRSQFEATPIFREDLRTYRAFTGWALVAVSRRRVTMSGLVPVYVKCGITEDWSIPAVTMPAGEQ